MAITFNIDGNPITLPTLQDVLDVDNRVNELAANVYNNEEQIRLIKQILNGAKPPEPVREGITVGPDDNLQEAIFDANGQKIWLKDGIYDPFMVVSNTRLQAINSGKAIIEGTIDWSDDWVKGTGVNVWSKELKYTFYQHPAKSVHTENGKPSARGLKHRAAMQPHMLVYKGTPMQPVYNVKDMKEGTFWLEGTSQSPVRIWAKFPGNASPSPRTIKLAVSQYLIKGMTGDVDGVEIDGLKLQFCANTGTFGAIHMEPDMDYWKVTNTDVSWTMSEGIRLRGKNHHVERCCFNDNGHVGMALQSLYKSTIINCETNRNVWRYGVDPLWHAGGIKGQYGINECSIKNHLAEDNNGAGIWLDIHNNKTHIINPEVDNNVAFGIHIEHHTKDGSVVGGYARNTRGVDLGSRIVKADLRMQRAITGYTFKGIKVGHIYYKKDGGTDLSGHNTFESVDYETIRIDGSKSVMPDKYINTKQPA